MKCLPLLALLVEPICHDATAFTPGVMNRLQWTTEFLHSTRECHGKDVSVRLQERLPRIGSPRVDTTLNTLIKALSPVIAYVIQYIIHAHNTLLLLIGQSILYKLIK